MLPVYKLQINDSDSLGVEIMSLVKYPAIETNWIKFNKSKKIKFEIQDEEQQIILGAALIPDILIYRSDESGEYNITVDKHTVLQVSQKFMADNNIHNVNIEHEGKLIDGISLAYSFVSNEKLGISNPDQFKDLPEGTWFVAYKVTDPELWKRIKEGEVLGFSIEGFFNYLKIDFAKKSKVKQVIELLEQLKQAL